MLSPALKTRLETAASVGVLTFAFAFVGALASGTSGTVPTTLAEWKPILAIAVAAGIASELVYLRTVLAQALAANAGTVLSTIESTASSVTSVAKDAAVKSLGVLAVLLFAGCLANGQPKPQTEADIQAAEADLKTVLPVACVIGEAIDPALLTAICAVADAADNLLTAPAVVVTATPAQAAALVVAHPASAAVAAKLTAVAASMRPKALPVNPGKTSYLSPPPSEYLTLWLTPQSGAPTSTNAIVTVTSDGMIYGANGAASYAEMAQALRSVARGGV